MARSTLQLGDATYTAPAGARGQNASEVEQYGAAQLSAIDIDTVPEAHPVRRFAAIYSQYIKRDLLPDETDLISDAEAQRIFEWAKHIEPIELDGGVDFKVLRQGARNAMREKRTYRDQWMCDTVDPEFVRALYREIVASSVLRKPLFSRGRTPTRERAFLYVIRGTFPVFAENKARLRILQIEAEPYVEV